ncbi:hypothetical protein [Anabaena sp. UHCC 0451]|uniref:hypothetical protein n=1 Tax=Anabaena sp. UHCC 0451 TaxID=2055235 RepID=UPI002B212671|nr:hypothetical protein [Anabaena sp. UHCC 0451]MEA5576381.1 hypothetical protein [Anabaena sp. UHCC 0451]
MNKIAINPDLANVDYTDLLDKILRVLQNQQIFTISPDGKKVMININEVVNEVIKLIPHNPLGNQKAARSATLNFTPGTEDSFREKIKEILKLIQDKLTAEIHTKTGNYQIDRFTFIKNLILGLQEFQGQYNRDDKTKEILLDFTYPFKKAESLQKQRLTIKRDENNKNNPLLKAHKVKIHINKLRDFTANLLAGINNYIDVTFLDANTQDREDLEYIIENLEKNTNSDIYSLQNLVNQETLGKLKKLAKIRYLEYLLEQIDDKNEGRIYLQDLIRRLKLLEEYINDSNKADGEYEVNYGGISVNYQTLFSRSEAYDILPIIPVIEGYLGEAKNPNQEEIEFTFGIKLKFNGKVQTDGGKTVYDYHLNLLNPDSDTHKKELADESTKFTFVNKILKTAFLYYFIFASRPDLESDLEYNPIDTLEKNVLPILRGNDDEAKRKLFRSWIKGFETLKIKDKIKTLKDTLTKLIQHKTPFPARNYPVHISVKNSILETDIDTINERQTIFKEALRRNYKDCLKYINLGDATTQDNLLITLPGNINISEIHFLETEDKETFEMEYDLTPGVGVVSVIFLAMKEGGNFYQKHLKHRNLLVFPHRSESDKLEANQEFIYKITYSLLAYLSLHVILERQISKDVKPFIPLLRIHLKEKTDNAPIEKFIVSLTRVLSHLFNDGYRSNEQGIVITNPGNLKFKIPNVLSSLYSVFPKKFILSPTENFQFQELDKLAIIVVSSRESDSRWNIKEKKSNLMGEIITIQTKGKEARFQLFKTFSENYDDHQKMFEYPTVVVDNVDNLYKRGYRHFIYIAKVPYSSTLHITQVEKNEELFFMSENVIKSLKKERHDIKIYPMFFEKYYAVKFETPKSASLYIQDTLELGNLVEDRHKQSVIFFNLFNGLSVADDVKYHGVMSYATLLNIYEGILDDKDIKEGLIYDDSQLKNEILHCLTLFHFSRYEKSGTVQLKLDPYQNLIGDESVSQSAIFKHIREKVDFNSLAFLTQVKSILLGKE